MACAVPVNQKLEEIRVEARPHIMLSSRNIPSDLKERYLNWYDAAYIQIYLNIQGYVGIDNYEIIKPTLDYPGSLEVHHVQNLNIFEETRKNPASLAGQKDVQATFYSVIRVWHNVYSLMWAFGENAASSEPTIVDNASFIHLDGYRVPQTVQGKYEQLFIQWASRLFIALHPPLTRLSLPQGRWGFNLKYIIQGGELKRGKIFGGFGKSGSK